MKYLNFASVSSDIKVAIFVHPNEFSKQNITRNLVSLLPKQYQNNLVVFCMEKTDTFLSVTPQLTKLPPECVITFSDLAMFKHFSGNKTAPKAVGRIFNAMKDKYVQYFNFSSRSLYLYANLATNRKCIDHIVHFLSTGKRLSEQMDRKLITPKSPEEVRKCFRFLMQQPLLGSDIETTSLKFYKAQLVSISFAVNERNGFTLHVKHCSFMKELKEFFEQYKGRIAWHGGSYDIKVLSYILFGGDSRVLYRTFEDTLFLHYICTNSPERFPRDLGTLTADLLGEYKLTKAEITDMMNVDPQKVCEYNLDDARGTYWLYEKLRNQIHSEYLYDKFKKWQWCLTQAELAGIPFSWKRMLEVDKILTTMIKDATDKLLKSKEVIEAMGKIRLIELDKVNAKRVNPKEEWELPLVFNPNSNRHLQVLLFDVLGLKPVKRTRTGEPSTDSASMKKLKAVVRGTPAEYIFDCISDIGKASKMQGTFIEALKNHSVERNGWHYLHGSYNLAKVVSGRLSSSDPNLQNLPSGTDLAKLFKSIFIAPDGYLWGGADYASLEERINTILTNDPAKKAVYHHGYDGHSYRAFYYFPSELTDIHEKAKAAKTVEEHVAIVNSIQDLYEDIRKKGKSPTFLLQYLGTAIGLVNTCGFSEQEAKQIYDNYYNLYKVSAKWLEEELEKVADVGYAEVAFGLRVYCYGITRAILNVKQTPKQIQEFIRTLGNAIGGQSYGQLTVDAAYKFLQRVYNEGLQDKVFFVATIHDANYCCWVDDPVITAWVNFNLIDCMMDISEHPELAGDIPLPAQLDVYIPSWDKPVTLKSHTFTPDQVQAALMEGA